MDLFKKTAIISGASSGLGRASAEYLAKLGVNLALFDLDEDAGNDLANQLGTTRAQFYKVDVRMEDAVGDAIEKVVKNFDSIHLCLNCAGIAPAKRILNRDNQAMPLKDFSTAISINLIGTFNLARLAAESMAKNLPIGQDNERGIIINTASIAAYDGQMGQSAYAASKSGIVGMTLPMARDLANMGIRVNSIAPGIMATPMMVKMPKTAQHSLIAQTQFPKRLGLPEEYARLVAHICENTYLNGETIRLDAAVRMAAK
tara:strand:+ start:1427 stop:2203 length:777 start_codon:yes stop_codon:yes gene_type:complete